LAFLQQCVYLLSIAIKDDDVVTWLTEIGLGVDQLHLLEYMITDTQDERRIWEVVCINTVPRKLALAFFLKTLLPIEALVALSVEGAETIKNKWQETYLTIGFLLQYKKGSLDSPTTQWQTGISLFRNELKMRPLILSQMPPFEQPFLQNMMRLQPSIKLVDRSILNGIGSPGS
jgi:hypothetical protein